MGLPHGLPLLPCRVPRSVERIRLPALVYRAAHVARNRVHGRTADGPAVVTTAVRVRHRVAGDLSVRDVTIHAGGGRVRGQVAASGGALHLARECRAALCNGGRTSGLAAHRERVVVHGDADLPGTGDV